jgi:hypothetical protein
VPTQEDCSHPVTKALGTGAVVRTHTARDYYSEETLRRPRHDASEQGMPPLFLLDA